MLRIDVDAADLEQPLRHRTEALCARPDVGAVRAVLRIDRYFLFRVGGSVGGVTNAFSPTLSTLPDGSTSGLYAFTIEDSIENGLYGHDFHFQSET